MEQGLSEILSEKRSASFHRAAGLLALAALVGALCASMPGIAAASAPMPNHHQMQALYVIDHRGAQNRSDADLVAYSRPFQKILAGCKISVDPLTNKAIALADQASAVGGRVVTSLDMLQAVARRIVWKGSKSCGYIFNLAEARLENGDR